MLKKTTDLLAIAKSRNGGASDYRIAQLLGIPPQTVSTYRVGRSLPAAPIAARLGQLCGIDPAQAVCMVAIERATTPEERDLWASMLERLTDTPAPTSAH